jgi:hypothetical protein
MMEWPATIDPTAIREALDRRERAAEEEIEAFRALLDLVDIPAERRLNYPGKNMTARFVHEAADSRKMARWLIANGLAEQVADCLCTRKRHYDRAVVILEEIDVAKRNAEASR